MLYPEFVPEPKEMLGNVSVLLPCYQEVLWTPALLPGMLHKDKLYLTILFFLDSKWWFMHDYKQNYTTSSDLWINPPMPSINKAET